MSSSQVASGKFGRSDTLQNPIKPMEKPRIPSIEVTNLHDGSAKQGLYRYH